MYPKNRDLAKYKNLYRAKCAKKTEIWRNITNTQGKGEFTEMQYN